MPARIARGVLILLCVGVAAALTLRLVAARDRVLLMPDPEIDAPLAAGADGTAVIAGGCFWGIQAVFQHVKGVKSATSGYSGGPPSKADYELVSTGTTGHAESVRITYDPSQISYG